MERFHDAKRRFAVVLPLGQGGNPPLNSGAAKVTEFLTWRKPKSQPKWGVWTNPPTCQGVQPHPWGNPWDPSKGQCFFWVFVPKSFFCSFCQFFAQKQCPKCVPRVYQARAQCKKSAEYGSVTIVFVHSLTIVANLAGCRNMYHACSRDLFLTGDPRPQALM